MQRLRAHDLGPGDQASWLEQLHLFLFSVGSVWLTVP